jgi:hypothetical protein
MWRVLMRKIVRDWGLSWLDGTIEEGLRWAVERI